MRSEKIKELSNRLSGSGAIGGAVSAGSNLRYLTGMVIDPHERTFVMAVGADGRIAFALPMLEEERVGSAMEGSGALIFPYADEAGPLEAVRQALSEAFGAKGAGGKVGVEHLRMRVKEYEIVKAALGKFSPFDMDPVLMGMRSVKDAAEAALLRRAAAIVDMGIDAARDAIRPGVSEIYVSRRIENALMAAGADFVPFNIVLSGPNAALPHGLPSERRIEEGELVICDIGACYKGYFGDITRTIPAGRPSERMAAAYDAVYRANKAGREAALPGMSCESLDDACRRAITEAGFGPYFIHRTGHGLGLDVHEEPYIVAGNKSALMPGMAFTIEPGVYLPDVGGVRIEDDVLVTEDGVEVLTRAPRELNIG